jgi:hypothetical protein
VFDQGSNLEELRDVPNPREPDMMFMKVWSKLPLLSIVPDTAM